MTLPSGGWHGLMKKRKKDDFKLNITRPSHVIRYIYACELVIHVLLNLK